MLLADALADPVVVLVHDHGLLEVRVVAALERARAHLARGEGAEAASLLESLLRTRGPHPALRLLHASALHLSGRPGEALAIAEDLLRAPETLDARCHHDAANLAAQIRDVALADLAGGIGDPAVRARGTLGGSIANNDPAADYPAAVLGLGATVVTSEREIAGDDFFTGMFETALAPGEIITAVRFPVPKRAAYVKFPNPASRYAVVGVFIAETADGVRVAVTGAAPCVFRVAEMEAALARDFSAAAIADILVDADGLNEDIHASRAYRAHLVTVMAKRAVAGARGT